MQRNGMGVGKELVGVIMAVWVGQSSVPEQIWLFREQRVFVDQVGTSAKQTQNSVYEL